MWYIYMCLKMELILHALFNTSIFDLSKMYSNQCHNGKLVTREAVSNHERETTAEKNTLSYMSMYVLVHDSPELLYIL